MGITTISSSISQIQNRMAQIEQRLGIVPLPPAPPTQASATATNVGALLENNLTQLATNEEGIGEEGNTEGKGVTNFASLMAELKKSIPASNASIASNTASIGSVVGTAVVPFSSVPLPNNNTNTLPPLPLSLLEKRNALKPTIQSVSKANAIAPSLVEAVIRAESGYNPQAKSSVGALGLMQLMPATAKELGVENPLEVKQNIEGGTKYLSQLMKKYDGNKALAVAAYNAGPGAVDKYQGIPPYKETQAYVKKVLNYEAQFQAEQGGL
jgi:soluble lytic murein transglycosylase-like protein